MSIATQAVKYLFILFLISSYKSLPLSYYFRFYKIIIKNLLIDKSKYNKSTTKKNTFKIGDNTNDIFKPIVLSTYVSPFECDFYLHKSNSTYFTELDISRTKLITTIFQKLFFNYQDNESPNKSFKQKSISNWPYIPVASVECIFKKELKPFTKYEVQSRVLCWDNKWLFILSKFVIPGKTHDKDIVCCVGITKYVFKNGRITIKPEEYIDECGMLNEQVEAQNEENFRLCKAYVDTSELEAVGMF